MPATVEANERLAAELLEAIGGLRRTLRRATGAPWIGSGMTGAQMELARLVRLRPGLSVNQAAEALQLAPNTVSALVGQLTDAGVLRRTPNPRDRRVARLVLSPTAQRRIDAWRDERTATLQAALRRLDPADRAVLEGALEPLGRLVEAIDG